MGAASGATGVGAGVEDVGVVRAAMVEELCAEGSIRTPAVRRAFEIVPRELFVAAGTPLAQTYGAWVSVAVKRDGDGVMISSTSAPFIQARMIEQAGLAEGGAVLEVGSGGYNAALLAEVVGPAGRVVSVDIDADIAERAEELLARAGYGSRVRVVCADAHEPVPQLGGLMDAVVVTAGAWDLAPAWLAQIGDGGRVVVPVRMNGITRSIAWQCHPDGHWVSTSAEVCGFVPMQGAGAHHERVFQLPRPAGPALHLQFDGEVPAEVQSLHGVLATGPVDTPSGVVIGNAESFADLQLWWACFLPGFCRLAIEDDTGLADPEVGEKWFPFGVVTERGVAYLLTRRVESGGVELRARGWGDGAASAGTALVEHIQQWNQYARHRPEPTFAYWPAGTELRAPAGAARIAKPGGVLTISWPEAVPGCAPGQDNDPPTRDEGVMHP